MAFAVAILSAVEAHAGGTAAVSVASVDGTLASAGAGVPIEFCYGDLYRGEQRLTVRTGMDGRFAVTIPADSLAEVEAVVDGRLVCRLLLSSGQRLSVERLDSLPTFSGDGAGLNALLSEYDRKMFLGSFVPQYDEPHPERFADILEHNMAIERKRMESAVSDRAPDIFRRWAETDLICRNGIHAARYAGLHGLTDPQQLDRLFDGALFPIGGPSNGSLAYVRYLHAMVGQRYLAPYLPDAKGISAQQRFEACCRACETVISTVPDAGCRDLFCGALLAGKAYGFGYDIFVRVLERVHDTAFTLGGEALACMDRLRRDGGNSPDRRIFTAASFDRLLEESERRVVYVDIWAAWCRPCLREMKHLHRLEERMAADGIMFVSLCVESKYDDWARQLDEAGDATVNYYLDPAGVAVLDGYIRVRSYPRFIVLSGGRIADENVQWPSSGETIETILRNHAAANRKGSDTKL